MAGQTFPNVSHPVAIMKGVIAVNAVLAVVIIGIGLFLLRGVVRSLAKVALTLLFVLAFLSAVVTVFG